MVSTICLDKNNDWNPSEIGIIILDSMSQVGTQINGNTHMYAYNYINKKEYKLHSSTQ